jgi:hypothetical protein
MRKEMIQLEIATSAPSQQKMNAASRRVGWGERRVLKDCHLLLIVPFLLV